jgi:hypothetical protein
MVELKALVLAGPDLAKDGVVRWRCLDLRSVIETRFPATLQLFLPRSIPRTTISITPAPFSQVAPQQHRLPSAFR